MNLMIDRSRIGELIIQRYVFKSVRDQNSMKFGLMDGRSGKKSNNYKK